MYMPERTNLFVREIIATKAYARTRRIISEMKTWVKTRIRKNKSQVCSATKNKKNSANQNNN